MDDELKKVADWITAVEQMARTYPDVDLVGASDLRSMLMDDLRKSVSSMRATAGIETPKPVIDHRDAMPF